MFYMFTVQCSFIYGLYFIEVSCDTERSDIPIEDIFIREKVISERNEWDERQRGERMKSSAKKRISEWMRRTKWGEWMNV